MHTPASMLLPAALLGLLTLLPARSRAGADERTAAATRGQLGLALGHTQAFGLNFPAFSPVIEFRAGYQASEAFLGRIDIGLGGAKMTSSDVPSFQGGWIMNVNLALLLAWTPRLSDEVGLVLGGTTGLWFVALFGDDLNGVEASGSSGSPTDYLEATAYHAGAIAGLEWRLSGRWALTFELRYLWAGSELGAYSGNLAGLTASVGFLYRMAGWDVGQQ